MSGAYRVDLQVSSGVNWTICSFAKAPFPKDRSSYICCNSPHSKRIKSPNARKYGWVLLLYSALFLSTLHTGIIHPAIRLMYYREVKHLLNTIYGYWRIIVFIYEVRIRSNHKYENLLISPRT